MKVPSTSGETEEVPGGRIKSRHQMDRSLRMSADQLGLSAEEIAEIVERMETK